MPSHIAMCAITLQIVLLLFNLKTIFVSIKEDQSQNSVTHMKILQYQHNRNSTVALLLSHMHYNFDLRKFFSLFTV